MADKSFGNENLHVSVEAELDSLTMMPLSDPKVTRAGQVLLDYINHERQLKCPLKKALEGAPHVTFAKVGMVDDARFAYHIEAVMHDEEFAASISHLPEKAQLANPSDAKEDPHNYLGRFAVVSVSPEPCALGKASMLVSTSAKVKEINSQKLSWTAKHRPQVDVLNTYMLSARQRACAFDLARWRDRSVRKTAKDALQVRFSFKPAGPRLCVRGPAVLEKKSL